MSANESGTDGAEQTTITLAKGTRDDLRSRKVGGESYDELLTRLMEETA